MINGVSLLSEQSPDANGALEKKMIDEWKYWKGKLERHTLPLDISAVTVLRRGWEGSICPISAAASMGEIKKENKWMAHGSWSFPFFSSPCLVPGMMQSQQAALLGDTQLWQPWTDPNHLCVLPAHPHRQTLLPSSSLSWGLPRECRYHQPPFPSSCWLSCLHLAYTFPHFVPCKILLLSTEVGMAVWYCSAWPFHVRQVKTQTRTVTLPRTEHPTCSASPHGSEAAAVTGARLQTPARPKPSPLEWGSPLGCVSHSHCLSCIQADRGLDSEKAKKMKQKKDCLPPQHWWVLGNSSSRCLRDFTLHEGETMLVIDSHHAKQSAQPQTLFIGDAELKVLVFAGVVVGGFFFNG